MSSDDDLSWLSLDAATGLLTGAPDDEQVGVYNITFSVEDSAGVVSTSDAISLTVQNINDPVYIDYGQTSMFRSDMENIYQIQISDEDLADSYSFTANNLPSWMSLDTSTGELSGSPTRADDGSYNVEVTVTDSGGLSDTKVIEITATSFEYSVLGSGDDMVFGDADRDHISTGGGNDKVYSGANDDVVVIQGTSDVKEETLIVTVSSTNEGNKYFINGEQQAQLSLEVGTTYIFDQSDPSNSFHPLGLSSVSDGVHGIGTINDNLSYEVVGITGQAGSYTKINVTEDVDDLFYFCEAHPGMGSDAQISPAQTDAVEVDTGAGDDRVVVEEGWSGTLFVKNGAGSNILEILGNQEDMDVGFVDGKVQLTIGNGSKITIDEQFVTNPQTGKVELSENGFEYIKTYGHDANGNALAGEYAYASYFVLGSEEDNLLVANQPSDAEDNDEVFIMAGDGADIIEGNASNLMIEGGRGDDLIRIAATSGNKSVFGDIFSGDSGGNVQTQNTNYSDVVEIDWSYYDSEISSIAGGYRIYNEDLAATVDIYDIEVLKFKDDNAAGGWDTRYLTDGQVIGTNEWHGDFAGTEIDYEGDNVSFVVDGDTLKVMADVTITTSVEQFGERAYWTNPSYPGARWDESIYNLDFATHRLFGGGAGVRHTEQISLGFADETTKTSGIIWEGERSQVDAFEFAGGITVNVINVADKDWNDKPIETVIGTDDIDLIFGNASDNLIDGGLGDDIIFGGDGDDVIIGGEGDDIITGGAGDDILRGDTVTDQDTALSYFAALTNFDDSQLSIDNSGMGTGGDDVIMGGDGIDDIDSGEGSNFVTSGRMDLDGDGEADLDMVKDFMEDNNIDNKDIFDDDDWV